jgi:predicted permease
MIRRTAEVITDMLLHDLRYGVRSLRHNARFAAAAILSLALGVTGSLAVVLVSDALSQRPLPVRDPDRLYVFREDDGPQIPGYVSSYRLFEYVRRNTGVFENLSTVGVFDLHGVDLGNSGGDVNTALARVSLVSGGYFPTFGVTMFAGRPIGEADDLSPGQHPVAVVSYDSWQRRMFSDPTAIGRTMMINGTQFSIVGIAPKEFLGDWIGRPTDVWVPKAMQAAVLPDYPSLATGGLLRIVGRLREGVTVNEAQTVVQREYQATLQEMWPQPTPSQSRYMARARVLLTPAAFGYGPARDALFPALKVLGVMVGILLLAACANVANLLVARGVSRSRELAVRLALGAGRHRLVRQLLTESVLLVLAASVLGGLAGLWAAEALVVAAGSGVTPVDVRTPSSMLTLDLSWGARRLAYLLALASGAAMFVGIIPSLLATRRVATAELMERGATAGHSGRMRFGRALIVTQIALSIVLLVGAGLLLRTFYALKGQELGVDRQHVLLVAIAPGQTVRPNQSPEVLVSRMRESLSRLPGIASVSAANHALLDGIDAGGNSDGLTIDGQSPRAGLFLTRVAVTPGFFSTAGIHLRLGRDVTEQDDGNSPSVAVVDETFAKFFFGTTAAVGRHFRSGTGPSTEIVGVASNAKWGSPRDNRGFWCVPYRQASSLMRNVSLQIRTSGNAAGMEGAVRRALRDVDPALQVVQVQTVEAQLGDVLAQQRLVALLAALFGMAALALASVGLYGVISYMAVRRRTEIGIRMAVGATRAQVIVLILRQAGFVLTVGTGVGVALAFALARLLSSQLFGVGPGDVAVYVASVAFSTFIGLAASLVPALRASRLDPLDALRTQ